MSDAEYEKRATMFGRSLHRDNRSDKELLDEALAVAAKSDVIVAALGESSEMSGESSCRTNLEMTDTQRILLQELLKTEPERKADYDFPEERGTDSFVLQPQEHGSPSCRRCMVPEIPQQLYRHRQ